MLFAIMMRVSATRCVDEVTLLSGVVPRSRIQHTDVSQGPLERRHGLGTLVVYTAGTQHSEVKLHGLEFSIAQRIRTHLLPRDQSDAV